MGLIRAFVVATVTLAVWMPTLASAQETPTETAPAEPQATETEPAEPQATETAPTTSPTTESPATIPTVPVQAETPQAPASKEATQLDDVVVTAQRRAQNLQQAPVAVTAFTPEQLEQRNVQTSQDLMQVTPSLQVSTETAGYGTGSATFFLRGMGQQRSGNGTEPAVGVYVDDIYYPSLIGSIFNILDLQQVEVLRGPQGTLFGRNTIGGAIRYTSRDPAPFNQAFLQVTGGTYDRKDVTGAINLAFGNSVALRVTAGKLQRNGYVYVQTGGPDAGAAENDLGRVQVLLRPTDTLRINVSGKYSSNHLDGFTYNQPGPINPQPGTAPWIYNQTAADGTSRPPYDNRWASQCDYCQSGTEKREYTNSKSEDANLNVQWTGLDWITIKSLTAWQNIRTAALVDADGSPSTIFSIEPKPEDKLVSQEFQFSGSVLNDNLDWIGGVFGSRQTFDMPPPVEKLLGIDQAVDGLNRITKTAAGFVDATYHLFDRALILGGVRYSQDDKAAEAISATTGAVTDSKQKTFRSKTGRAGFQYQWNDALMTYLSVSSGFRAGGFNLNTSGTIASPTYSLGPFNPEQVTSYETGARTELLGGLLRVNPTIFYAKWNHIQVQSVDTSNGGINVFVDNAGKAHSEGVELEVEGAVSRHLLLFGNSALLKMKYDSIGDAKGITTDSEFMRAPRFTYSIGGRYQDSVSDLFNYTANLNWSWEDHQQSSATDNDSLLLPSYGLLSSRLEVTTPGKAFELALFGTNLTNHAYYVGGADFTASVGTRRYDLGRPREFGLSLRYNY